MKSHGPHSLRSSQRLLHLPVIVVQAGSIKAGTFALVTALPHPGTIHLRVLFASTLKLCSTPNTALETFALNAYKKVIFLCDCRQCDRHERQFQYPYDTVDAAAYFLDHDNKEVVDSDHEVLTYIADAEIELFRFIVARDKSYKVLGA